MKGALLLLCAALTAVAQEQQPRPVTKDGQGLLRVNKDFYETAAQTGGDFYFWAGGEFATSRLEIPLHSDEVVLAYGTTSGRRVFEVPVESDARELTLFWGVQRQDLTTIVRPDGTSITAGDEGVALQKFQHMTIARIATPAAGLWRVETDGSGLFSFSAHIKPATITLGAATVAADVPCSLQLDGHATNVRLAVFGRDGSLIESIAMKPAGDGEYLGTCTPPNGEYRLGVIGEDRGGAAFQRIGRALQK